MHISPYEQGNRYNVDPVRPRKLLLHRQEIRKLIGYTTIKGLTLVPLNIYLNRRGLAKMEIGVARGKKLYDKREDMARRDADRRMQQSMKKFNRLPHRPHACVARFAQDFFRRARELKLRRARRVRHARNAPDGFAFARPAEKRQARGCKGFDGGIEPEQASRSCQPT